MSAFARKVTVLYPCFEVVFLTFDPKLQVAVSETWKGETEIYEMTDLKYK